MAGCESCIAAMMARNADREKVLSDAKQEAKKQGCFMAVCQDGEHYFFIKADTARENNYRILHYVSQYNT